jgi:hypothetical protein
MNDLVPLQYNNKELRNTQYKNIKLFVVQDVLRSIVDIPEEELCSFWRELKKQLDSEGFDIYCEISKVNFDGFVEECVDRATIFRIVQSINSPQAEAFKQWFASLAEEKIEESMNPALAVERAMERYAELGYSPEWIKTRIQSLTTHSQLLNEWSVRGATTKDYEKLSNTINKEIFDLTIQEHKDFKNVTEGSLKDNMSAMELAIINIGELATLEIHKNKNSQGVEQLNADAIKGGRAANSAKEQVEEFIEKPVLTSENALDFTQQRLLDFTEDKALE